MNWFSVFYWLTVADSVKNFFDTTSNIVTWFAVISFIVFAVLKVVRAIQISDSKTTTEEEDAVDPNLRGIDFASKAATRFFYINLALAMFTWFGYVATPTKKDCLMIIAGGAVGNFLTSDSSAKELPRDITNYLHLSIQEEIKDLGIDTRAALGVLTPKEKLVQKAKELTKEEFVKYMEADSTTFK